MALKLKKYDAAEYLETQEDIAIYMEEAFNTGEPALIAHCLGVVARAKGMSEIAAKSGIARERLYKAFSKDGNPTLKTLLAVMNALGLDLTTKPHSV
jgi:probable addiction module antidote protein